MPGAVSIRNAFFALGFSRPPPSVSAGIKSSLLKLSARNELASFGPRCFVCKTCREFLETFQVRELKFPLPRRTTQLELDRLQESVYPSTEPARKPIILRCTKQLPVNLFSRNRSRQCSWLFASSSSWSVLTVDQYELPSLSAAGRRNNGPKISWMSNL